MIAGVDNIKVLTEIKKPKDVNLGHWELSTRDEPAL
jgi:hypothetical protein